MSDRLVELSTAPWFRQGVKQLGLPIPTPQMLKRPDGPRVEQPLRGLEVAVCPGTGVIDKVIASTLTEAGANPIIVGRASIPTSWSEAGEAFGRPAQLCASWDEGEDQSPAALIIDASEFKGPADLRTLYDFFNPWLPRLKRCSRVIVIGRTPESAKTAEAAAAHAGLEGFIRSVAREVGRKGATAHVIYVAPRAERRLAGLLRFLLSDRSAFISGQPWRLSSSVKAPKNESWSLPLDGQVALVTGAARGIGAATAAALAAEGAMVVCLDRPGDEDATSRVAQEIGGVPLMADITDDDAPARIQEALLDQFGGVDIVIHNAGITRDKTLARMKPEWWDQAVDVNLGAVLRINERLFKSGLRDGGRVVCLSSVAGLAGNVGQTNYAASKAGLVGYVSHLGPSLAKRGIAIHAVAPGFIETRLTNAIPVVTREAGRRMSALGQGGQPQDVAELLTFLSTPSAAGLTGQVIRACGGMFIGA